MKEVLLIEACSTLMASRMRTLRSDGYHVTGVSTAAEALGAIQHNSFDLIIADAAVPDVIEALANSQTACLIMVDEDRIIPLAHGLPMGIWSFLVKPFTNQRFRQAVSTAIKRTGLIKDTLQQRVLLPLNSSSRTMVSEAEMNQLFRHIVEMIAAETEAEGVAVLVQNGKTAQPSLKASLNVPPENSPTYHRLGDMLMKTAAQLVVNDRREADPYTRQIMGELGASSLMAVPLLVRERPIGAISAIIKAGGNRFTHANVEFLSILAKQLAVAIENAELFKSVEKQRRDLEKMLERAVRSQENERKRVAVEIHDSIGQQLIGALYRVQAFSTLLSQRKFEKAAQEAEEIRTLLEKSVSELRRVLAGLRPHNLDDFGLISALRQEAEKLAEETKIACRFTCEGPPVDLTPSHEAAIYRIVQEALTNIKKHARATEAAVEIRHEPEALLVAVRDNGRGFLPEQASNGVALGHMGLAGMKERAEMLGGSLSIDSRPGRGDDNCPHRPVGKESRELGQGVASS